MDVSIIIVNYNTLKMTSECIDSVIEKTHGISYEIILVDNGSSDGSKEYFEHDTRIKYIYSENNLGFGQANNIGAKHAIGKYLFLLNSDTILIENSINVLYDFLRTNHKYVACGCQLIYADGSYQESHIKFPSLKRDFNEIIPAKFKHSKRHDEYYRFSDTLESIDSIKGANIFIKSDVFKEFGGFDVDYFMYYEETDLFYRIKNRGYQIAVIPDTKIIHIDGGSFAKISIPKYLMMYQSKLLFYSKHHSITYQFLARLILSTSILVRSYIFKLSTFHMISAIWK